MLDELHALVEFAQAGSIAGAADRLFRTPSAITRQLQRLEAELGAELLGRHRIEGEERSRSGHSWSRAPDASSDRAAPARSRSRSTRAWPRSSAT